MPDHAVHWGLASYADDAHRTLRLVPSGELDLATARFLDGALRAAQHQTTSVTLDLRRLRFMDCSSLALLAGAADRARRSGSRFVVQASPMTERLFALTGFDRRGGQRRLTASS